MAKAIDTTLILSLKRERERLSVYANTQFVVSSDNDVGGADAAAAAATFHFLNYAF